jgi:hypothetical protein
MDTKCPNQLFYDWLVLNRACRRVSPHIMIFVYVCSTGGIVELSTRFEMWITRTDVTGVSLFHLSYLITRMVYLWSQRTPDFQRKYFMFDWWNYRLFVLNTTLKRNSVQVIIFVNVYATWSMVYIKDAFWYVINLKWIKWCKFVSPTSYNNTYGLPMLLMDTKGPNQVF